MRSAAALVAMLMMGVGPQMTEGRAGFAPSRRFMTSQGRQTPTTRNRGNRSSSPTALPPCLTYAPIDLPILVPSAVLKPIRWSFQWQNPRMERLRVSLHRPDEQFGMPDRPGHIPEPLALQ